MITAQIINDFLANHLIDTDIFIVDVSVKPGNKIYVFIDSTNNITIKDCARINHLITENFDRETEDYALEVSSAGLTAPFKVEKQYVKNIGKKIKIKTTEGKVIKGTLNDFSNNSLYITEKTKIKGKINTIEHVFLLNNILETKLDIVFF